MNINEAIELLEAPFVMLDAHLSATTFVLENATANQRNLIDTLTFPHRNRAILSLARQQAQKVLV